MQNVCVYMGPCKGGNKY